jgi:hypothetical protein
MDSEDISFSFGELEDTSINTYDVEEVEEAEEVRPIDSQLPSTC